jgi:hypothetical protein
MPVTGEHRIGIVPSGAINGANATYNISDEFDPDTLEVFSNGVKLFPVDDYTIVGSHTIILTFSPATGEKLTTNYYTKVPLISRTTTHLEKEETRKKSAPIRFKPPTR